jgi:Outer membrane protein/protective antigen OMA87
MKAVLHFIIKILVLISLFSSCSSTKFVGDGEYLLDKVEFASDNKDYKTSDFSPYLRQQPNFKAFGLMKWQLYVYNWSGHSDKNWLNRQLRRMGEAPIIMDTTFVNRSREELERFLINKGYIHAEISSEIDTSRYKKAVVTYHIKSNDPFRIGEHEMNLSDAAIDSISRLTPPKRSWISLPFQSTQDQYASFVKEGNLFDRDILDRERQRISSLLRNRGYYAFNRDYLVFQADSSSRENIVDLEMLLRPVRRINIDGQPEEAPHQQYYIKDVSIVTGYNPLAPTSLFDQFSNNIDTVVRSGVNVLYGNNKRSIRSSILQRSSYIRPGELFSERDIEQTYSAFSSLKALRNVNIRFDEIMENDTMKLNAMILTSNAELQGFGVDLDGTNSNGDFGFASSLNYQHRNLFKGSELFSAKIRGAYESLSGKKGSGFDDYWEIGGEASVTFPRFLFPFVGEDFRKKIRATTQLQVSYNRQRRPEYERAILSGGWSYSWQDRTNSQLRHTFKPLDIDYVYLPKVDVAFRDSLPATIVRYNYSDQFIVGAGYAFSFSNYSPQHRQRNTHSMRFSLELAGNTLYGLSHLVGAKPGDDGRYNLLGINYFQFIKTDIDFSQSVILDNRNNLAFHIGAGVGVPYGNADQLPFQRRYFSGGANTLRGWSVRSLGPGSMTLDSASFVTQVGDIRLVANLEYRTKLFWKFEMAAYVDAGNIWTIRPYEEQKNGNFDLSRFYKEIAVSYGLGLRMHFDFFLIRLDTGLKAYDPQRKGSERLTITNPNLRDNFAWHFAVGYPF